jgi:hypothetical protein
MRKIKKNCQKGLAGAARLVNIMKVINEYAIARGRALVGHIYYNSHYVNLAWGCFCKFFLAASILCNG